MKLPSQRRVRPTESMSRPTSSGAWRRRLQLPLLGLCASALLAQTPSVSSLPATAPTAAQTAPLAATPTAAPSSNRPHRAQVTWLDGEVTVVANDSSLHQILRSIADRAHITITGGVQDQRVFGTYGPASTSTILATLLDGTGVNLLFRAGDNNTPGELVLTPRSEGPAGTPITAADADLGDTPSAPTSQPVAAATQPATQPVSAAPQPSGPPSIPQPANNVLGSPNNTTPTASQIPTVQSVPIDSVPTPSTTVQTQQGIVDSPNPPPPGSNTPATPDSIYQQLLQLQKAKAAAQGNSPSPATPPAQTPQ